MDVYHKVLTSSIGVLVIAGILGAVEWLKAHDAQLRAEAQVAADQQQLKKIQDQQQDLANTIKQIQADNARQLQDLSKTFAAAQTPAQLAAVLSKAMGQPVIIHDAPPATKDNPNPTATVELPDAPRAKLYVQECEECKINYANAQKQLQVAETKKQLDAQTISLKDDQINQLQTALKGGSKFKRVVNRVRDFAIDAGIFTAIFCGTGHCK